MLCRLLDLLFETAFVFVLDDRSENRIWTVHLCDACYSGTVYFPISIALFLLSVVMTIIALFDGGGSKKRRFSLDNGDEVTEKSGLFGEKYYEGRSGKSYETNDNGRTFSEK